MPRVRACRFSVCRKFSRRLTFCAEQQTRWYEAVEKIPDGPTVRLMQEVAKKHGMVIIVPIYEEEITGVYYNTAAVIDADGKYLGKYRKNHIPHVAPGFWEKFYFKPGNLGYPTFETALCAHRRLYLLRPTFPRRRAGAWFKRRGDRL
ncbi:MAG: nitrilase-related carbon-nitrogen hydrolase [Ilumatobacteraceae bacterium]